MNYLFSFFKRSPLLKQKNLHKITQKDAKKTENLFFRSNFIQHGQIEEVTHCGTTMRTVLDAKLEIIYH